MLCGASGSAIARGRQHRQHEPLQERSLPLTDPVQYLAGHGRVRLVYPVETASRGVDPSSA